MFLSEDHSRAVCDEHYRISALKNKVYRNLSEKSRWNRAVPNYEDSTLEQLIEISLLKGVFYYNNFTGGNKNEGYFT